MITDTAATSFRQGLEKFITFSNAEWDLVKEHLGLVALKKKKHFTDLSPADFL